MDRHTLKSILAEVLDEALNVSDAPMATRFRGGKVLVRIPRLRRWGQQEWDEHPVHRSNHTRNVQHVLFEALTIMVQPELR